MKTTAEKIAVMQAYEDGKTIVVKFSEGGGTHEFSKTERGEPTWDWSSGRDYWVKEDEPDSIDWSHVAARFTFMARDENGEVYLYDHKPAIIGRAWIVQNDTVCVSADRFSSLRVGTIDWSKSLVERPA